MCKYLTIISNSKKFLNVKIPKTNVKKEVKKKYDSWEGSFIQKMILNSRDNRGDIFLL